MSMVLEAQIVSSPSFFPPAEYDLTVKQKSFADNYLVSRNGVQSARDAGYEGNDATLSAVAYENLRKPQIRAYLESCYAQMVIGSNETLAELSTLAKFDVLANPDSPIRAVDKLKALELAGKFYKHWDKSDDSDVGETLKPMLIELLAAACERVEQVRAQRALEASTATTTTATDPPSK
jgi:hypothetical protein